MTDGLTQNFRPRGIIILGLTAIVVQLLMQAQSFAIPIAATLVTCAFCAFVLVPTGALFPFYLLYLLFEGAVKILSNYNPVLHVGSDILLLATFWRLYQRKNNQPDIAKVDESTSRDLRVAVVFFALFWVWVAVQFFNPVGIGLLPSIASLKLHLMPYLCFFTVCFLLSEREVETIAYWILGLVFFEAIFGEYQPPLPLYLPFLSSGTGVPAIWDHRTAGSAGRMDRSRFHGVVSRVLSTPGTF
jgi:hypothetical protein